jgi:hypothetical protein
MEINAGSEHASILRVPRASVERRLRAAGLEDIICIPVGIVDALARLDAERFRDMVNPQVKVLSVMI